MGDKEDLNMAIKALMKIEDITSAAKEQPGRPSFADWELRLIARNTLAALGIYVWDVDAPAGNDNAEKQK